MSILSAAMMLFLVMDPIGNVPMLAAILRNVDNRRWSRVIIRENLVALATLLFFLFFGPTLMGWLSIRSPALTLAGGLVLFIVALQMIFPRRGGILNEDEIAGEPLIVPLAIPLIAGPSTMALVMLMATRAPERRNDWVIALLAAWGAGLVIFLLGSRLQKVLGPRGLAAAERLMGMILVVVAVEMLMTGVEHFLQQLNR